MFTMLCLFGRLATATEPEFLRILLHSSRFKAQYDPAKREPFPWQIDRGRS